ncbi:ATP-binding protein [Streptomyces tubbatahanensis]|uniref:ATP-binding protein n=1 Tax=Streptomyces tubbatahanensis TaxID=2923272 RepID=A0ABY3XUN2_9ACTN|nr:ATP-binding protein [Streptomyces tubbatahanensis]UNS98187.1 ATP-binding protein [Streptomyces tubbatahanensis]
MLLRTGIRLGPNYAVFTWHPSDREPLGAAMGAPQDISFHLSRHRSSVPRARVLLVAVLSGRNLIDDVAATGELIISELVTNAVRARAPQDRSVGVRIRHLPGEGLLRLEVSDAGEGRPVLREPDDDELGGRGLLLVDALAHRWGVDERMGGIGKTVWAELKADVVPAPRKDSEPSVAETAEGSRG